ncbi:hypothetical protein PLICRDRAFT_115034 [Plicaturopsis crispa FD-325 SS-3]|nr:hypothetical protein PLICRDRAFT_115034 [Plicaturopsis crispa FD-325 SS-3]
MSFRLVPTINPGPSKLAGSTAGSKALLERLLDEDRQKHHCFFNTLGFHNHLSHHLYTAYDLGASEKVLQAIYDEEAKVLRPIHLDKPPAHPITAQNWMVFVGQHEYYSSYLTFFTNLIVVEGPEKVLNEYLFSDVAKGIASMPQRFLASVFHSMIETGFGIEFGCNATIAQDMSMRPGDLSLLEVLSEAYRSDDMKPIPYDAEALRLLESRLAEPLPLNRQRAIVEMSMRWSFGAKSQADIDFMVEELFWVATLLLVGTSKPGRKPRVDFFIAHVLNATMFLPSLLPLIANVDNKFALLELYLAETLGVIVSRGRPRIDPDLVMTYTDTPSPPNHSLQASCDALQADSTNPWSAMITSALHAPDAHTIKAIRTLYYAARKYGETPVGCAPGAFSKSGQETHKGAAKLDGTMFVRAAGVILDLMGWVAHGQPAGLWDRSGLGWDEAWTHE